MVHAVNFHVLQLVSCMFLNACRTYYRVLRIFPCVALISFNYILKVKLDFSCSKN